MHTLTAADFTVTATNGYDTSPAASTSRTYTLHLATCGQVKRARRVEPDMFFMGWVKDGQPVRTSGEGATHEQHSMVYVRQFAQTADGGKHRLCGTCKPQRALA